MAANTVYRSVFSQDGQYYAHCGNDGKLKIWETASGRLRQEYTPNRHLSSPCSVIEWISASQQSAGNASVRHTPCALERPTRDSFPLLSLLSTFPPRVHDRSRSLSVTSVYIILSLFFFFLFICSSWKGYVKPASV